MLGVSSYAYAWRRHPEAPAPFTVEDIFDDAVRLGVGLVQLCDLPELESADDAWLADTRAAADERGLTIETGTKGIETEHLLAHLRKAEALGATLVRSMLSSPRGRPTLDEAIAELRAALPAYEAASVTLGLETYEQFATDELLAVIDAVGSPNLGVVLDPGNSVARLELPSDVIAKTAPHVVNLHVKDFAFARKEAMIGFTFAGAPLGEGLLDYDAMADALDAAGVQVNHVIEHWLPRGETLAETCQDEREWVDGAVAWLQNRARA